MKKVLNPIFILLFIAAPQLLSLAYLALVSGVSGIGSFIYPAAASLPSLILSAYAYIKRKEEPSSIKLYIVISVIYTLFIASGILFGSEALYPKGLISPRLVFVAACAVSVLYSILGIAYHTTSPDRTHRMVKYIVGIIMIPLVWFLGVNFITGANSNTLAIILIVACMYAVLFMSVKLLFIWRLNKGSLSLETPPSKKYYILMLITSLCMPLGGLALNQGFSGLGNDRNSTGLFGDFSNPLYYIIAALNGIFLLIPPVEDKRLRLLLFYLKSVGYAYILYFFVVFLPGLPLGILGLIFCGLGIFVFTPAAVTILQGFHLIKEWIALSKSWGHWRLTAVFCMGVITLPLCITATFWSDKENFTVAAQYLEQNSFNHTRPVNLPKLRRTLKNIKGGLQLTRGSLGFPKGNTPILSSFYTDFVLGGKTISQENILTLENLFFDTGHNTLETNLSNPSIVNNQVRLLAATSETKYDEKTGVYRSWVNLKLENPTSSGNGEYKTTFKLPEGAYISDYYLHVGGVRKEGMLTDRRAALFIYRKIVNTRRDPGLLHYIGRNTLELRVFPFTPQEVRETGFEVIHSQKLNLNIDNKVLTLGGDNEQKLITVPGAVLLPPTQKASLKPVVRKPKYYFIVDSSKNSNVAWHKGQIQEYANANNISDAAVIFASYKLHHHSLSNMMQAKYQAECGFNLHMAVGMILSNESTDAVPIIIAVSDNMPGAVFPKNIYPLSGRFPESPYYYALNHNLTLTPYSYEDNQAGASVNTPVIEPILNYDGTYVLANNKNELVLTGTPAEKFTFTNNQYKDAVLLDAMRQKELLNGSEDSLELVRASFRSRILTPQTAFIVVETQQQEKELLDLQERILNNSQETPTVTLDEPSFIGYTLLFLVVLCILKRKKILPTFKKTLADSP